MSQWKCVILVPTEFELSYANSITAARRGLNVLLRDIPAVEVGGRIFEPKALAMFGPEEAVNEWAKQNRPKPEPTDEGPSAA